MKLRAWTLALLAPIAVLALSAAGLRAETIRVLALGASNTNGKGVERSQAWPAQLESMLRAKGYDASVSVNAIDGDTSAGVLYRARNSIPDGTRVVIFDTGGDNDRIRGESGDTDANARQIAATIRAHGAAPIRAPYMSILGPQHANSANYLPDGIHLTPASHRRIAAALLPRVIAAIGQQRS